MALCLWFEGTEAREVKGLAQNNSFVAALPLGHRSPNSQCSAFSAEPTHGVL